MGRRKRRAPPADGDGDGNGAAANANGDDGRPENTAGGAAVNYAGGEAERYHGCATVRRLQADLTRRALALMAPGRRRARGGGSGSGAAAAPPQPPPPPPPLFLDLGCGSGLSGAELCARGVPRWLGLDVSPDMLALAAGGEAGVVGGKGGGDLVLADLAQGLPLRRGCAPAAVSISAVQWLLEPPSAGAGAGAAAGAGGARQRVAADQGDGGGSSSAAAAVPPIDRFFAALARCLLVAPGAGASSSAPSPSPWDVVAAIQVYGRDRAAVLAVAAAARRAGFRAALVADWPHRTRAIKAYALLGRPAAAGTVGAGAAAAAALAEEEEEEAKDRGDGDLYAPPQCSLVGHVDCGCSLWWRRRRRERGEEEEAGEGGKSGNDEDDDDADDAWVLAHHRSAARRLCRLLWGAAARGGHLREALSAAAVEGEERQKPGGQGGEGLAPWLVATLDVGAPPRPRGGGTGGTAASSSSSSFSSCWGGLAVTVAGTARALARGGLLEQEVEGGPITATPMPPTASALADRCRAAVAEAAAAKMTTTATAAVASARLSPRAELEAQAERTSAVPADVYEGARWWGEAHGTGVMSGAADQAPVLFARAVAARPAEAAEGEEEGGARRLLARLLSSSSSSDANGSPASLCAPLAAVVIAREDGSALAAAAYYCCWSAAGGGGGGGGGGVGAGGGGGGGANEPPLLSPHVTAAVAAVRGDEATLAEALRPALEGLRRRLGGPG